MTDRAADHLPNSLEAERTILGAILLHEDILLQVVGLLGPADFWRDAHRRIFTTMLTLSDQRSAVDFLTVQNALHVRGDLDEVGGPAYLASLVDGLPRTSNVLHYAAIVREKARLRSAIAAGQRLIARAYEQDASADILAEAGERLLTLGGGGAASRPVLLKEVASQTMDVIQRANDAHATNGVAGLPTGLVEIDAMTTGFYPGELVIVGARTSIGKTGFGTGILRHVAKIAKTGLMFSLEMHRTQVYMRFLSLEAKVNLHKMRGGWMSGDDWANLSHGMDRLGDSKIVLDDSATLTVLEMRARARAVRAEHGLDVIVVDYLQLVSGRGENRTQIVGSVSRGLKALAKELNVPVIALAQLNRLTEARKDKKPQLSDLRESGDIESDADIVILLWRNDEEPDTPAEAIFAKQRNGPTGTVKLAFVREYAAFQNANLRGDRP